MAEPLQNSANLCKSVSRINKKAEIRQNVLAKQGALALESAKRETVTGGHAND